MPFSGHLNIISFDPVPSAADEANFFWLNSQLGIAGEHPIAGMSHVLPRIGGGIAPQGDPSDSAVIGLATRDPVKDLKDAMAEQDFRRVIADVVNREPDSRSISVFEFKVAAARPAPPW